MWFVDYLAEVCKNHCDPAAGTPSPSPSLDPLAATPTMDPLVATPTMDPLVATPTMDPLSPLACAEVSDSTTKLYTTPEECCSEKLGYIDTDLCVAISTDTHSEKYFVSYAELVCKQDCEGDAKPCAGYPSDTSTKMFDSVEDCCGQKLQWVNTCVDDSLGDVPTGSGECCIRGPSFIGFVSPSHCVILQTFLPGRFYVDWDLEQCVTDCPKSAGPPCGGIAPSYITGDKFSDDEATCCEKFLNWPGSACFPVAMPTADPLLAPTPDPLMLAPTPDPLTGPSP